VAAELTELEQVEQVLVDLNFLDPEDGQAAEALLPFLTDKGLTPKQVGNVLERVAAERILPENEIEPVLTGLALSETEKEAIRVDLPPRRVLPGEQGECLCEVAAAPTATPAPIATPVPAATQPAATAGSLNFETFGPWKRGDQPYGQFNQSSDPVKEGSQAGKLSYDFSQATPEDDFVVFSQRLNIAGEPNLANIWVYGDGSGHLLNLWIEDAQGEVWSVAMGSVGPPGWQQLSGVIAPDQPWPSGRVYGPDNGQIDYPIRLNSLVLDRTGGPQTGMVSLDDITFSSGPAPVAPAAAPQAGTPEPAPGTPAPQTGPTVIDFTVSRTQIKQGECVDVSWYTENVREVYYQWGGQAGVGSRQECPLQTTVYTLRVVKPDGSEEIREYRVDVEDLGTPIPPPPPPPDEEDDEEEDDDDDGGYEHDEPTKEP
jgi:hypothetical protein